ISPFPYDLVKKEAAKYPNADLIWAQEEAKNQGSWTYVQPRFVTALSGTRSVSSGSSSENNGGWLSGLFSSSKPKTNDSISQTQSENSSESKPRIVRYVGRPTAASPATGSKMQHLKELKQLLDDSFNL
ncbi:hypothetical protein PV325_013672, partial [Microctonus aethiopoides]